jgi:hypothetical protein
MRKLSVTLLTLAVGVGLERASLPAEYSLVMAGRPIFAAMINAVEGGR